MDWASASLTETADAIQSRRVRARDVLELCLERYRNLGKAAGCVIDLDEDAARRQADAADAAVAAGAFLGPLHGIPMAHKDMFHRQGRVTRFGSKAYTSGPENNTATVLERLDKAGAVDIGRLHTVEFALGPHGINPHYPPCRNPWDLDHIPSGSSSGSGVAVAIRMVHAALGSDTGGSIRGPAAMCGVVGLMPTHGRVSRAGVGALSHSLDTIGPLTRTVRDAARILDVIAGPDPRDPSCTNWPTGRFELALDSTDPLPTIGIARGFFDDGIDDEVARAIERAGADMRRAGLNVVDVTMPTPLLQEIAELHPLVLKCEAAANHTELMRAHQSDYGIEVAQRIEAGFFIPASDYVGVLKARGSYLRSFAYSAFAAADLILTPTLPVLPPKRSETNGKRGPAYTAMVGTLTRNTKVINFLGLPAIAMPCGFSACSLPVGFQLVGRPYGENAILRAGDAYQRHTDWHLREPRTDKERPSV